MKLPSSRRKGGLTTLVLNSTRPSGRDRIRAHDRLAWIVLALAMLSSASHSLLTAQTLRKGPYCIYPGNNTTMEVLWQGTAAGVDTIEWGLDSTVSLGRDTSEAYGSDAQHRYLLGNLVPGDVYHYRVSAGGAKYAGSFRAAPPDSQTTIRFFVYGDTRSNPGIHDRLADSMIAGYTRDPGLRSMVVCTGDLVSSGDLESAWTAEFFNRGYEHIQEILASVPYQSAMGNHEGSGVLFQKYFPYPFAGSRYWSYDYGPAHIAFVDQYVSYAPGSSEYVWLDHDLAASSKRWKFIVLHEPGWSAAGGHANNTSVQQYIQPLCEKYDVAIVFAGHNHYYARAVVVGGAGDTVDHVTTGGGGAPLHTPAASQPNIVTATSAHHYCAVSILGDTVLQCVARSIDGVVLDSFRIARPSIPTDVSREHGTGSREEFRLDESFPNPFNPGTTIRFRLPRATHTILKVFDVRGKIVATLVAEDLQAGTYNVRWDGRGVASGVYFCRLEAGPFSATRKLLVLK